MPAPARTTRTRAAIAAIALGVLPLAACGNDDTADAADVGGEVVTTDIVEETDQPGVGDEGDGGAAQDSQGRIGEQVELTAEVAALLPPDALTVGGDTIGENPILVVGADVPAGLTEGDTVMITGTVIEFQVPGYEEDLDLDLVDQEFEDFDGDPAIQATAVTRS